ASSGWRTRFWLCRLPDISTGPYRWVAVPGRGTKRTSAVARTKAREVFAIRGSSGSGEGPGYYAGAAASKTRRRSGAIRSAEVDHPAGRRLKRCTRRAPESATALARLGRYDDPDDREDMLDVVEASIRQLAILGERPGGGAR